MRATRALVALGLLLLIASTVDVALAQNATTNSTAASGSAPARGNATHQAELRAWAKERHENFSQFRNDSVQTFREGRDALEESHDINVTDIQITLLQGRVQAIKDCRAQADPVPANASGPHGGVYRSCMEAKMKDLRSQAQAARQAELGAYQSSLKALRDSAKAQFEAAQAAWLQANPKP